MPEGPCRRKTMVGGICRVSHQPHVVEHDKECSLCHRGPHSEGARDHNRNRCPWCRFVGYGADRVREQIPRGCQPADLKKERKESRENPWIPLNRCEYCLCHFPAKGSCRCPGPPKLNCSAF